MPLQRIAASTPLYSCPPGTQSPCSRRAKIILLTFQVELNVGYSESDQQRPGVERMEKGHVGDTSHSFRW